MGTITLSLNRFHSGELDPALEAAVDTDAFQTSCRTIDNFWLTMHGTLEKRPGSYYLGHTKGDKTAVFKEYKHTDGTRYMFEFTDLCCRFWTEAGNVFQYSSTDLELVTPYAEADLAELNVAVSLGEMFIFHRDYAPRIIKYSTDTFTITTPTFIGSRTFSTTNNYPGVGGFHAGRLFVGGSYAEPTAIFASKPPDSTTGATNYLNFAFGSAAVSDAIYLQESDLLGATLEWFAVQKRFICGTSRSNWMSDGSAPIPATFDMTIQTHQGAAPIQAKMVDGVLCYVGRAGLSLRVTSYSLDADGLVDSNIAKRSNHIIKKGITSLAVQTLPPTRIWISLSDGTFASCLIDTSEGIIGWTPHSMGGDGFVEYLDIQQREENDDLYLCVRRTINGSVVRYVEVIHILNEHGDTRLEEHCVDCGFREAADSAEVELVTPNVYSLGMVGPAGGLIGRNISGALIEGYYYEIAPAETEVWSIFSDAANTVRVGVGTSYNYGEGAENTAEIIAVLDARGESGRIAQLMDAFSYGGYTDWFLPSAHELTTHYYLHQAGLGGFTADQWYYSSSLAGMMGFYSVEGGKPNVQGSTRAAYSSIAPARATRKFEPPTCAIVTAPNHGFANDDLVTFKEVEGATSINNNTYMIKNITDDTFELYDETGTTPAAVGAWGEGGVVTKLLASTTISGLDHLEDETIDLLIDGGAVQPQHVQGGEITVSEDVSVVHGGIPYRAKTLLRKLEVPSKGSSQGKFKKVEKVVARLNQSRGGSIGQDLDSLQTILYERYGDIYAGDIPERYTGDVEVALSGKIDKSGDIWIVSDDPMQFNLLGVFPRINISEK